MWVPPGTRATGPSGPVAAFWSAVAGGKGRRCGHIAVLGPDAQSGGESGCGRISAGAILDVMTQLPLVSERRIPAFCHAKTTHQAIPGAYPDTFDNTIAKRP